MSKEKNTNKKEKQEKTVDSKAKVDKKIIIGGIVLIVVIIAVILIIVSNDKKTPEEPNVDEDNIVSTEKTVEDEYGFSKDDAINSVKGIFNGDVYEFDATVREDNMYIVTVTNTETGSVYTYIVNPNDGSFQELIEE